MTAQIALVTGANRGIGFAICRLLAQRGIQVILTSRNIQQGEAATAKINGERPALPALYCPLDVADLDSVEAAQRYVRTNFGRLDILINNAGVYPDEGVNFFNLPLAMLEEVFAINTFGPFRTCRTFVPMMIRQNYGRVVNISSEYGSLAEMSAQPVAYRMSKAALNAMTRILADEVRGHNIKVNAMCPGWVRTDMGGPGADLTPEEGADTAIWLATLPDDGPTDGFFQARQPLPW